MLDGTRVSNHCLSGLESVECTHTHSVNQDCPDLHVKNNNVSAIIIFIVIKIYSNCFITVDTHCSLIEYSGPANSKVQ